MSAEDYIRFAEAVCEFADPYFTESTRVFVDESFFYGEPGDAAEAALDSLPSNVDLTKDLEAELLRWSGIVDVEAINDFIADHPSPKQHEA